MRQKVCDSEARILEALGNGRTLEALEEPLRRHIVSCASCSELISIYELFQSDNSELSAAASVPEAGRVWWRANLAARRAAADRAMRPILIAEKAALAVGGGVLIALLIFVLPWLARLIGDSHIFPNTVAYAFPVSSLIITSITICVLLMAAALITLWAEK